MRIDPTEEDLKVINEIERTILCSGPIQAALVRNWLALPSLAVQTVATDLVLEEPRRIEPPLSMEEICNTMEGYYKECLIQDVEESEYVPNWGIAGYELVRWFRFLWKDPAIPREYLLRIKTMLRDLFLEKKVPMLHLVNSVLEHLFEFAEVQEFFSDWKSDPVLAEAYALAKEWGDDHLDNPLP